MIENVLYNREGEFEIQAHQNIQPDISNDDYCRPVLN